jgi:predicted thioredoxin/glutaredoxin
MTKLLQEAFQKASNLPEELQDELAREVLDELVREIKWDETLANSSNMLDAMAQDALDQFEAGDTESKCIDEL